ncbi:MAG: hypothetical protein AAGD25_15020 [Cyanobacteria bacterium P01_F01_bin.150]
MAERNPRVQIVLSVGTYKKLERYAKTRETKPSSEAAYIVTRVLDELDDAGKIPHPIDQANLAGLNSLSNETHGLMQSYLKLLASGSSVPDEIIQMLAKETELTEEELKGIRDRLSSK